MIHYKNYAIVTPAKTGSVSVTQLLIEKFSRNQVTVSAIYRIENDRAFRSHHQVHTKMTCLRDRSMQYIKALLVRNPYDRLISSFFYLRYDIAKKEVPTQDGWEQQLQFEFENYVAKIVEKRKSAGEVILCGRNDLDNGGDILTRNLSEYYKASKATYIIKMENAIEDLKQLNIDVSDINMPHYNQTQNRTSQEDRYKLFTAKSLELANLFCQEDAEKFGYPVLFWDDTIGQVAEG